MALAEAFGGDRQRPVRQHQTDRHLVESDLAVDVGADTDIATEEQEGTGGERMPGASGDHRDRTAVQPVDEGAAVTHQPDDSGKVATAHHVEVEPGAEPSVTTMEDERSHGLVRLGGVALMMAPISSTESAFALPSSRWTTTTSSTRSIVSFGSDMTGERTPERRIAAIERRAPRSPS